MRKNNTGSGQTGSIISTGLGIAATGVAAWALRDFPAALGGRPDPHEMERSPQYRDGAFRNTAPTRVMPPGSARETLRELIFGEQTRYPRSPIPIAPTPAEPAADGLHITW